MKGSEFVFDYVDGLFYTCHKISLNHGGSYIDSPQWLKTNGLKPQSIQNNDNKCFNYEVTVALIYGKTTKNNKKINPSQINPNFPAKYCRQKTEKSLK